MDGIPNSNRVDTLSERKLHAKVIDNVLNSATYASRLMGMGKPFTGKQYDYTIKITDSLAGQFFLGLENLNTSASDTTITLSFAHAGFTQPVVIPMLEAMANSGVTGTIPLRAFKTEEAEAEAISRMGTAIFGTGTGGQPLGLEAIVDDGSNVGTIGGQSRTTYTQLNSTVTDFSTTLSLAKLATLTSAVSASGVASEEPTIHVTTKTIWDLYEQLLHPNVRAEYQSVGYNKVPVRGNSLVKSVELKGGAGFTGLSWRAIPVIKDDKCTAGTWYALNENYLEWRGRTIVPDGFSDHLSRVSLGKSRVTEGVMSDRPSDFHGFFFQKEQMLPNQAGIVGRYYVIGNAMTSQPRRHGKGYNISSI